MLVQPKEIIFSQHAIKRMFERAIHAEDVKKVIKNGEIVEEYSDDKPHPSYLLLGFVGNRPVHVLVAMDSTTHTFIVITAYIPDNKIWYKGYKKRRTI